MEEQQHPLSRILTVGKHDYPGWGLECAGYIEQYTGEKAPELPANHGKGIDGCQFSWSLGTIMDDCDCLHGNWQLHLANSREFVERWVAKVIDAYMARIVQNER